ncbi:MAG: YdcF family protein [Bacteroidota bacterium]|nr:YdcF family protein [Bacteroidota bacterium]
MWEIPLKKVNQISNYDIGIVLGGGVKTELRDTNRVFLNASGDRLIQAVQLYKMGKIKKILYAGGAANLFGQKVPEATQVLKFLKLLSIPDTAIIIEPNSVNTFQNAKFSAQIILNNNLASSSKLLITSSLHMRRSLAVFQKQGINCDSYPVDMASESGPHNPDFYFIPSLDALLEWQNLLHEIAGFVTYKIMGYL